VPHAHQPGDDGARSCCAPKLQGSPSIASACEFQRGTAAGLVRRDAVSLPGGSSIIGTDRPEIPYDGEGPARRVTLKPFAIDRDAVTGADFRAFVAATGYVTEAEHFGWSFVFHLLLDDPDRYAGPLETPWWRKVDGASWAHPEGPGSSLDGKEDHPVVHVSLADAMAYASWAGGRLPSEAEWEYAARGGLSNPRFPWGDEEPDDQHVFCNIWQGDFPALNTMADGFVGTAPVKSYAPNGYGLHNMIGNVWEWCSDAFRVRSLAKMARLRNAQAAGEGEHVMKGGSFLCHASYCYRYRIAARLGRPADTAASNTGFRVAYDDAAGLPGAR